MQNYVQPGDVVSVVAPYALTGGQGALVGNLFGVAVASAASGATVQLLTEGVATLAKNSAEAWTVGLRLYWDNTAKVVTLTSTANTLIGCAMAVAANPSATGVVRMNGSF